VTEYDCCGNWSAARRLMQVGPDEGEINVHQQIKREPLVPDQSSRSTVPIWNWFHTSAPAFAILPSTQSYKLASLVGTS